MLAVEKYDTFFKIIGVNLNSRKEEGVGRTRLAVVNRYSLELKRYWAQWDSLKLECEMLQRKCENADGTRKIMQILLQRNRVGVC